MYSQLFGQILTFCLFVPVLFFRLKIWMYLKPPVYLSILSPPPSLPEATTVRNYHYGMLMVCASILSLATYKCMDKHTSTWCSETQFRSCVLTYGGGSFSSVFGWSCNAGFYWMHTGMAKFTSTMVVPVDGVCDSFWAALVMLTLV